MLKSKGSATVTCRERSDAGSMELADGESGVSLAREQAGSGNLTQKRAIGTAHWTPRDAATEEKLRKIHLGNIFSDIPPLSSTHFNCCRKTRQFYYQPDPRLTSPFNHHPAHLPLAAPHFSHLRRKSPFSILLPHSQTVRGSFIATQSIKLWLPYLNSSK